MYVCLVKTTETNDILRLMNRMTVYPRKSHINSGCMQDNVEKVQSSFASDVQSMNMLSSVHQFVFCSLDSY